ncbi:hypothetical protein [Piscinibacter sakaiensis]|uniref:hypothetical protein n=1 Tax=Piscinibacter sakaiensis TaxID=1547922 RepID=UPI003AAB5F78
MSSPLPQARLACGALRRATQCAAIALAAFASPIAALAATDDDVERSPAASAAFAAYERTQWASAFDQFAALADGGDEDAARIALLMARHGRQLYGIELAAPQARRDGWMLAATRAIDRSLAAPR